MKKKVLSGLLVCALHSVPGLGWNAVGHRLIAQIAVDNLTPQAYVRMNAYNHALDRPTRPQTLVSASVWLDTFHRRGSRDWNSMHYFDLPFSDDGSPLPAPKRMNAVLAIREARQTLLNPRASVYARGLAVRILLHVVGDIHQPLHAVTRVSKQYPKGDRGGNLSRLPANPVSTNLHTYWDRGAGLLPSRMRPRAFKKEVARLEARWPCAEEKRDNDPMTWAQESHAIALRSAYSKPTQEGMVSDYPRMAVPIVEERLAKAGCRLAALLNGVDEDIRAARVK